MAVTQGVKEQLFNDSVPLPSYVLVRVLGAGVAESFTAPAGANFVAFSGTTALGDYWVNDRATAAIPIADVTDGSGPWLNPGYAQCVAGSTISVISANAGVLCAAFYRRAK